MKINILLPFKEEFDSNNSGAVSIFVKNNIKYSKLKKKIYIFGVKTKTKEINFKYLPTSKYLTNYNYVRSFSKILKKDKSIIELHNRPQYFNYLKNNLPNNYYILYFHNNPLELNGSKSLKEREYIIKNCNYLIFISDWVKNKFFTGLNHSNFNNYQVIYHSLNKIKKIPHKKKIVFFCGKLNKAKGYDLFCESTKKFLKFNPDWKILSAGTETRRNIKKYDHVQELGQIDHRNVLKIIKHSKITVAPSIWNEPLGRLPIESAALGSVCISSSNGGLPESNKFGLIINDPNSEKIFKALIMLSNHKNYKKIQKRILNNTFIDNHEQTKKIDYLRSTFLKKIIN
jgi:glycosyltransferase involved in cell wall biosynthesis